MNDKPFRELIGKVRPLTYDGIEPEPRSGRQEHLENIVNRYV